METPKWADTELSTNLPIIREAGESDSVDFKETFPEDARRLAKTLAAFGTSGGGDVIIGIDDNGDLVGIDSQTADARDACFERVHGIASTVRPVLKVDLFFAVESEKTVLLIRICTFGKNGRRPWIN